MLVQRKPKQLTLEFSKADRGGRILIDIGRNRRGATFAAAYTVRAKPTARRCRRRARGRKWSAARSSPQTFTLRKMAERLAHTEICGGTGRAR